MAAAAQSVCGKWMELCGGIPLRHTVVPRRVFHERRDRFRSGGDPFGNGLLSLSLLFNKLSGVRIALSHGNRASNRI